MPRLTVRDFDLRSTVECGQLFTYARLGEWYYITGQQKLFAIRQREREVEYRGVDEGFIRRFFRLDDDLVDIRRSLKKDPIVARAFSESMGLRLVRLELWEAIVGFICSQACNIPRIRTVLKAIAEAWGGRVELDGFVMYLLPRPQALPGEAKLREAGAGFRARYLKQAAERVDDALLDRLRRMDYHSARRTLLSIPGVGPKIADCVCLFSLGFLAAFPIDTWIRKMMRDFYFHGSNATDQRIRDFGQAHFGEYAGYAQQYLYAFYRRCPLERWNAAAADGRMHFPSGRNAER